jgi:maleylpyruvate isomerase
VPAVVPTELIEGVRAAHERLHATLAGVTDGTARQPSRLPGWTVGHVLTHLARNADSVVRRLSAAAEDRAVDQYAGGVAGRDADIESGAGRPAAELVADVRAADAAVDGLVAGLPAEVWARPVRRSGPGGTVPAERLLFSRWREVEVHHVDLGLAYTPADWPAELVALMLPGLLDGLADRAGPAALAAWALDRGPAPTLTGWDS